MSEAIGEALVNTIMGDVARCFPTVNGLPCMVAQTGEEYVEITLGGVRASPWRHEFVSDADMAAMLLGDRIFDYIMSVEAATGRKRPTVYWRCTPELDSTTATLPGCAVHDVTKPYEITLWKGYARLLASFKAPIYDTVDAWKASMAPRQAITQDCEALHRLAVGLKKNMDEINAHAARTVERIAGFTPAQTWVTPSIIEEVVSKVMDDKFREMKAEEIWKTIQDAVRGV